MEELFVVWSRWDFFRADPALLPNGDPEAVLHAPPVLDADVRTRAPSPDWISFGSYPLVIPLSRPWSEWKCADSLPVKEEQHFRQVVLANAHLFNIPPARCRPDMQRSYR